MPVTPVTDRSFGLLIAYVIPGFAVVVLWGVRLPLIGVGLSASADAPPTVGGFLYTTVASVLAGLVLSTLRWALLDQLHHRTGLNPPAWRHVEHPAQLDAYRLVVDLHYRYYQFYGSSLLVMLTVAIAPPSAAGFEALSRGAVRGGFLALALLFLAASRDALQKYYARGASPKFFSLPSERNDAMTNGGHHDPAPPILDLRPASRTKKRPAANGVGSQPSGPSKTKKNDTSPKKKTSKTRS